MNCAIIRDLQCAVSVCLLFASTALAERQAGALTASPMVSCHVIDGSANIDNASLVGFSLGYNLVS